jgi:hypothetical protein
VKHYTVIIEGTNCVLDIEGNKQRLGFFATRLVSGKDEDAFSLEAMQLVREEIDSMILNEGYNPPQLMIDQQAEIMNLDEIDFPTKGFTWYIEADH